MQAMKHRTRAYWPARIILAIPFVSLAIVALLTVTAPTFMGGPHQGSGVLAPLGAVAASLWIVGTLWMVRIFRGPREDSGDWRYRS
jgi:hypothetical protein